MATADELLAAAFESEIITVDLKERTLNIPASLEHIGVESDDDVFALPFSLPRYYGDIDFAEFDININYLNAGGQGDVYDVTDAKIGADTITFAWLVGRRAAAFAGNVSFNLCLKKYSRTEPGLVEQEFNTVPSIVRVMEGLETLDGVTEQNPELLTRWMEQMCAQYNALSEKVRRIELAGGGSGVGYSEVMFVNGILYISPGTSSGGTGSEGGTSAPIINTHTLIGAWVFNEKINLPNNVTTFNMSATYGKDQPGNLFGISADISYGVRYHNVNESIYFVAMMANGTWGSADRRYIDFGSQGQKVTEAFYNWFIANATKYVSDDQIEEEASYDVYIYNSGDVSIYVNGDESLALPLGTSLNVFKGLKKFKFATRGVNFIVAPGAPADIVTDTPAISITQDEQGWYVPDQTCTIKITSIDLDDGSGDSGGTDPETPTPTPIMYSIAGKWIFNKNITWPESTVMVSGASILAGPDYSLGFTGIACSDGVGLVYGNENTQTSTYAVDANLVWSDDKYRYVDFGSDGVSVNETFYKWFTANAVQGVYVEEAPAESYTLHTISEYAFSLLINNSSARKTVSSGVSSVEGVSSFKFADDGVYKCSLFAGGMTDDGEKLDILPDENGWYILNQETSMSVMLIDESNVGGDGVLTHSVTYNLVNCHSVNPATTFENGAIYSFRIEPDEGYELSSVSILVGDWEVPSDVISAYLTKKSFVLPIKNMDADVVVTAVAVPAKVYVLRGKYTLKSTVSVRTTMNVDVAAYTGSDYSIQITGIVIWPTGISYAAASGGMITAATSSNGETATFADGSTYLRYLDFGELGAVVGSEFYDWIMANAVKA